MNKNEEPCDRKVACFLSTAREQLRDLLVPESESLVTVLGHLDVAFEYTAYLNEKESVGYHCRQALRIVEAIERRQRGDLPDPITTCLNDVRRDVEHALRRIQIDPREKADGTG